MVDNNYSFKIERVSFESIKLNKIILEYDNSTLKLEKFVFY